MLALRAAGCQRDAEDVAIAKETAAHAFDRGLLRRLRRAWGVCAGYGYRPLRLLWALPFVYLFSGALYSLAALQGVMAPTNEDFLDKSAYQHCRPEYGGNWSRCALAPAYPDFYPWAYALQMAAASNRAPASQGLGASALGAPSAADPGSRARRVAGRGDVREPCCHARVHDGRGAGRPLCAGCVHARVDLVRIDPRAGSRRCWLGWRSPG